MSSSMTKLLVYHFMAEIGTSQITVASGSCTEASNTRQCTKRKKVGERRKGKGKEDTRKKSETRKMRPRHRERGKRNEEAREQEKQTAERGENRV